MKDCACKGIRTCLKCEPETVSPVNDKPEVIIREYVYCHRCVNRAFTPQRFDQHECSGKTASSEPNTDSELVIDGIFLQSEVITPEEEADIIESIDSRQWVDSQSGRRKQDFGPKINFKKRKINFDSFAGLPELDIMILDRIKSERLIGSVQNCRFGWQNVDAFAPEVDCDNILRNFKTVEVCHLEYMPERGSSIDPHFDDFWIWGERLVTLNLLSSTVISLSHENIVVRVPLPARSFLVLYGDARFKYKHAIERSDVSSRRLAITYRELPAGFLVTANKDYIDYGRTFIEKSNTFIP